MEKAYEFDDGELAEYFQKLQTSGATMVVQSYEDEPEFHEDASPYTEVIQHNKLEINGVLVHEWDSTYWGHFGGSGSGWWIERSDSSIDFDVENLLEMLDLLPQTPDVPTPSTNGET